EMGMAMMGSGTARGEERAMTAAEMAISNPLLDDVNLSGANGILVNITAGPDFTMREFDEVGRTIEEFASEDATVVIGTVLDPDMQDEVRVTVVATGLNRQPARQAVRGSERGLERTAEREVVRPQVKLVRNGTTGQAEYHDNAYTTAPTTAPGFSGLRSHASYNSHGSSHGARTEPATSALDPSGDAYLDIPAFLRRQAD
ncbi:MAG TPA: cell division protein FtsZ, partial [Xanthomonadaceae bacterium]|nr:cell division protein FtsZ [Xanthomonadaceae bacterium]